MVAFSNSGNLDRPFSVPSANTFACLADLRRAAPEVMCFVALLQVSLLEAYSPLLHLRQGRVCLVEIILHAACLKLHMPSGRIDTRFSEGIASVQFLYVEQSMAVGRSLGEKVDGKESCKYGERGCVLHRTGKPCDALTERLEVLYMIGLSKEETAFQEQEGIMSK